MRSIIVLAMALLACHSVSAQDTNQEIQLKATVQDIVPLPNFRGRAIPVDATAMFALTLRIESVTPAITNFTAGSVVTFAIHSPIKLFAEENTKGKTYDFLLQSKTSDGKIHFSNLQIQRAPR